ncbi:hypothetical protein F1880_009954 [Penicillium rolfsii]|nr:hypothetical protein F1880_009954 [Penicillium rolfsii]
MLELIRMLNQKVAGEIPEDGVLAEHSPAKHWDWHDLATERTGGIDFFEPRSPGPRIRPAAACRRHLLCRAQPYVPLSHRDSIPLRAPRRPADWGGGDESP